MKNIILVLLMTFIGFTTQAQEPGGGAKKNKNAKVDVEVSGNCEMCKKRIENAAYSVSGVKSAVWHPDDQILHLIFNEQKCSVLDVESVIAKAGHNTKDVKANETDYNKLHTCCQYDRK